RRGRRPRCLPGGAPAGSRAPRTRPPAAPAPGRARCRGVPRIACAMLLAGMPSRVQSRLGPDRRITPADLFKPWTVPQQCIDAARVEQLAALLLQPFQRLVQRPGWLVRPGGE